MNYGWICSRCNRSNAPFVRECGCSQPVFVPTVYPGPSTAPDIGTPWSPNVPGTSDPLPPLPSIICSQNIHNKIEKVINELNEARKVDPASLDRPMTI